MRSLKIIIFRDTDKPYTMILSPKVLIGTSFSIVALFSLLTFSVMSNVMFVTSANIQQSPNPEVQGIFADNQDKPDNENADDLKEETKTEPSGEEATSAENQLPADENQGDPVNKENQEETPVEELAENEPVVEEQNIPTELGATSMEPVNLTSAEMEVAVVNGITVGDSSIRLTAQVRKRTNRGVSSRGRFVAALLRNDGTLSNTFPVNIRTEGTEILNPEKGDSFRIKYSRDYDVRFNNIRPEEYSSIVLMIYDQENLDLIWRNVVPVSN